MSDLEKNEKHEGVSAVTRGATVIGGATSVSRLLGFIRDVLIAQLFGTGMAAEAFVVAFRLPNLLRDFVAEGATNSAIVPVLSAYTAEHDTKRFWRLVRSIIIISCVVLCVVSVIGVIASPLLVRLIAPGFSEDPEKFRLTVRLTRIMFPFIMLIGLSALAMGILNTLRHFTVPAFGPAVINVCLIVAAVVVSPFLHEAIYALAGGVLVGGCLQLGMQLPVLARKGFRFRGDRDFRDPELSRMGAILFPRLLASCVHQVSVFIDTILASLAAIVGTGGVAALYYANRLIQLPLAIFAIATSQAILPVLSLQAHNQDHEAFKHTVSFGLRMVVFVSMPASIGLILLARPITSLLFERGAFTAYSCMITSQAVMFYAIGLCAYAGIKILVSAFHSMRDTRTPLKIAAIALVINIVLNLILMWPLGIGGLALATSIASAVNCFLLFMLLGIRIGGFDRGYLKQGMIKISVASVFMTLCCLAVIGWFPQPAVTLWHKILLVTSAIAVSTTSYCGAAYVLAIEEVYHILPWLPPRPFFNK